MVRMNLSFGMVPASFASHTETNPKMSFVSQNIVRGVKGAFEFLLLPTCSCGNQPPSMISHGGFPLTVFETEYPVVCAGPRLACSSVSSHSFCIAARFLPPFEHAVFAAS
jgi:hypothetical protein